MGSKYRANKVLACDTCGTAMPRGEKGQECPSCNYLGHLRWWASKREHRRFCELLLAERAGEVSEIQLQPAFPVWINGQKVATYRADFRYWDETAGEVVVEDSKGYDPAADKLRRRIAEAYYDMEVRLV